MILRLRSGQVLIELTIALAVAMVAILALVQSATKSISNSTFSKSQTQATQYASEAVEWLRNQKNASWPDFYRNINANDNKYCFSSFPTIEPLTKNWVGPSTCGPTDYIGETVFIRQMVYDPDPTKQTITITVKWTEKNKDFSAKQVITFSEY